MQYQDDDEPEDRPDQDWDDGDGEFNVVEDDDLIDGVGFADPGGRSSLRAATRDNPRIYPCPECGAPNVLTRLDVANAYVCDLCADAAEGGY